MVAAAGVALDAASDSPTVTHRADGVRYTVPAGWNIAPRSLTPHLVNPREVLTASTGLLPRGGPCHQLPGAALAAMRPSDVLVTVQERFGSPKGFPSRPARFRLPADENAIAAQCAGGPPAFVAHWFGFRDGGRGFHVLVAVGREAPQARVREALGLLDSLQIARRRPVRIDGDDALPYRVPERRLELVHPSDWRVYRRALTEVVPASRQIALGTFPLRQREPDPNCAPETARRARPPGGGFLFVFEYPDLNRRQLADFPRRPQRLRLRRRLHQPYEYFGLSWLVRFRDHGRAFQAHIYGPPERRRESLAILDSLRVGRLG